MPASLAWGFAGVLVALAVFVAIDELIVRWRMRQPPVERTGDGEPCECDSVAVSRRVRG